MNNSAGKPNALHGLADVKSLKIEELEPHLSVCEAKLNWAHNQVFFLRHQLYQLKKMLNKAKIDDRKGIQLNLQMQILNTNGIKTMYDNYIYVIELRINEVQRRIFESKFGPSTFTSGPLTSFGPSTPGSSTSCGPPTSGSSTSCGPSSSGPSTSFGLVSRPFTSCSRPSTSASCSRPLFSSICPLHLRFFNLVWTLQLWSFHFVWTCLSSIYLLFSPIHFRLLLSSIHPSSGPSASFYPSTPSTDIRIPFYHYIPSVEPLPSSFGPSSSSDATTFFDPIHFSIATSSVLEDSAFVTPSEIDERK
ncbi:hypothetical protein CDAR_109911 [Caerostris darwini]|uniref:Uncharacterized protein n=1 Tax=Caerostris darwini TaxID=1538125 RepID=A0AAV4STA5_9ARAC|nr:hypothetical protein CDAR_109911 [Caerostris darwini]